MKERNRNSRRKRSKEWEREREKSCQLQSNFERRRHQHWDGGDAKASLFAFGALCLNVVSLRTMCANFLTAVDNRSRSL